MNRSDHLETRLWAVAVQAARGAGMTYTVPCSRNVRDLISAGAAVMRREHRVAEADQDAAQASLSLLAAEMIRVTRTTAEKPPRGERINIRETALVEAKKLCPVWPFG